MKVICTACNKKIDYDKSVKGNSGSSVKIIMKINKLN